MSARPIYWFTKSMSMVYIVEDVFGSPDLVTVERVDSGKRMVVPRRALELAGHEAKHGHRGGPR